MEVACHHDASPCSAPDLPLPAVPLRRGLSCVRRACRGAGPRGLLRTHAHGHRPGRSERPDRVRRRSTFSPARPAACAIAARLKSDGSWTASDASIEQRIQKIVQNPPIEQQGNTIRIGRFADEDLARNISISYDVTVPADTKVTASTGSGSIVVGAVKGAVTANSGSGSIRVDGAAGLKAHTGSGVHSRRRRVAGADRRQQRVGQHHGCADRRGRGECVGRVGRRDADRRQRRGAASIRRAAASPSTAVPSRPGRCTPRRAASP